MLDWHSGAHTALHYPQQLHHKVNMNHLSCCWQQMFFLIFSFSMCSAFRDDVLHTLVVTSVAGKCYNSCKHFINSPFDLWHHQAIFTQRIAAHWMFSLLSPFSVNPDDGRVKVSLGRENVLVQVFNTESVLGLTSILENNIHTCTWADSDSIMCKASIRKTK